MLDEADRMIDLGFEEEIRNTLDHYRGAWPGKPFSSGFAWHPI